MNDVDSTLGLLLLGQAAAVRRLGLLAAEPWRAGPAKQRARRPKKVDAGCGDSCYGDGHQRTSACAT